MSPWIDSLQSVHSIGATSDAAEGELAGADDSAATSENEVQAASPGTSTSARIASRAGRPRPGRARCRRMITSLGVVRHGRSGPFPNGGPSARQHLGQVVPYRDVQLVVCAARGLAVGPPAEEVTGVTKSTTLELVVLDLHHEFGTEGYPREVLLRVPPADRTGHPVLTCLLHL